MSPELNFPAGGRCTTVHAEAEREPCRECAFHLRSWCYSLPPVIPRSKIGESSYIACYETLPSITSSSMCCGEIRVLQLLSSLQLRLNDSVSLPLIVRGLRKLNFCDFRLAVRGPYYLSSEASVPAFQNRCHRPRSHLGCVKSALIVISRLLRSTLCHPSAHGTRTSHPVTRSLWSEEICHSITFKLGNVHSIYYVSCAIPNPKPIPSDLPSYPTWEHSSPSSTKTSFLVPPGSRPRTYQTCPARSSSSPAPRLASVKRLLG